MLTSFQQFLAACIGQTEEETDQPDDAQHDDEPQTELELATDDNPVSDVDPVDAAASEHVESEEKRCTIRRSTPRTMLHLSLQRRAPKRMRHSNPTPIGDSPEAGEDNVPEEVANLDSAEGEEGTPIIRRCRFGF